MQEVRPEEGPQGAAVLQAVAGWPRRPLRHRRCPGCRQRRSHRRAGARPRPGRGPGAARPRLPGRPGHPPLGAPPPGRPLGRPGRRGRRRDRPGRAAHPGRGLLSPSAGGCPAAVVSASHNPFEDNGIKLFGPGGTKLTVETEAAIEASSALADPVGPRPPTGPRGGAHHRRPRRRRRLPGAPGGRLGGPPAGRPGGGARLRQRRGRRRAPGVFAELGAEVTALGCDPDGTNINDGCGSTDPEDLAAAVVAAGPTWGWPSTATPTAWWPSTTTGRWPTATPSWPCSPSTWPAAASSPATPWWSRS